MIRLLWCLCLFSCWFTNLHGQDINFKGTLFQSIYSDDQWPGITAPRHQGYSFGFDVVIEDGSSLIIPGLYFQKTSLRPEKFDIKKPFQEFTDVKTLKLPFQLGLRVIKTDLVYLHLTGGVGATYLLGVDENDKLVEEDFNELRGSFVVGASLRVFFLSAHIGYDHGFTRIYSVKAPSGIVDKSKEKMFSVGLGVYF